MRNLLVGALALVMVCGACQKPTPRLNAPPHGVAEEACELQDTFNHMIDNGLLVDMTISDIHFMPHRPILNALGQERISRLAQIMDMYGGVIRFNTDVRDESLIAQRTEAIMTALEDAGLDTSQEVLRRDMAGGDGLDAAQCILIKTNEATYKPKKDSGSSLLGGDQ